MMVPPTINKSLDSLTLVFLLGSCGAAFAATFHLENLRLKRKQKRLQHRIEGLKQELHKDPCHVVEELDLITLDDDKLNDLGTKLTMKASEVTVEVTKRTLTAKERKHKHCVVCLEKDKTHTFIPCGHMSACGNCADRIMTSDNKVCPVCRMASHAVFQVYT